MNKKIIFVVTLALLMFAAHSNIYSQLKIDSITTENANSHNNNKGKITINVSGGNAPYKYVLNKGFFYVETIMKSPLTTNLTYTFTDIKPGDDYWIVVKDEKGEETKKLNIKIN